MEDQPVEVVGDVGERQFRLGPRQPDDADEQAVTRFLTGEDMLGGSTDRRRLCIGPRGVPRHRLVGRLAPMNAAAQHALRQPRLGGFRPVSAVGPDC